MPSRKSLEREQRRVDQGRLALPLAPHEPPRQRGEAERRRAPGVAPTASPPSCHTRMLSTMPPMPITERHRADRVDVPIARVRGVVHELDVEQDDRDDHDLEREAHAPRQVRGDEPAQQRPDRGGDRGRGADQRVGLALRGPLEVPVDERLHGRQQQRGAEPSDDRPEDDDGRQALRERHRQRPDGVAEQPEDVRALASDQVADLAPDQDEGGGDQGLERDRRLHAADRGVQVPDHRGDRHVHQRRVDDQHEHRHRQQDHEPGSPVRRLAGGGWSRRRPYGGIIRGAARGARKETVVTTGSRPTPSEAVREAVTMALCVGSAFETRTARSSGRRLGCAFGSGASCFGPRPPDGSSKVDRMGSLSDDDDRG